MPDLLLWPHRLWWLQPDSSHLFSSPGTRPVKPILAPCVCVCEGQLQLAHSVSCSGKDNTKEPGTWERLESVWTSFLLLLSPACISKTTCQSRDPLNPLGPRLGSCRFLVNAGDEVRQVRGEVCLGPLSSYWVASSSLNAKVCAWSFCILSCRVL